MRQGLVVAGFQIQSLAVIFAGLGGTGACIGDEAEQIEGFASRAMARYEILYLLFGRLKLSGIGSPLRFFE